MPLRGKLEFGIWNFESGSAGDQTNEIACEGVAQRAPFQAGFTGTIITITLFLL